MFGAWLTTLLVSAIVQSASSPAQATSKWEVSYAATYCEARRDFSDQGGAYSLAVRTAPTVDPHLAITAPRAKGQGAADTNGAGSIQLESTNRLLKTTVFGRGYDGQRKTVYTLEKPDQLKEISASETVIIDGDGVRRRLKLTAMPSVMQALATCERDLLGQWGIDPALPTVAVTRPEPKGHAPAVWSGADAYPADALAINAQGTVMISLLIDESGSVATCTVLVSSGHASLDRAACAPMKGHGSSFRPAVDKSGNPVPAQFILPIVWTGPDGGIKAMADAPFGVIITSR